MEAKVEPTKNVSVVGALVISERIAQPRLVSMGDHRNLRPKEKVLEVVRKKIPKPHKMCHWEPSILGPFEVLSDHGDKPKDDGDVDEFLGEATGTMPLPPPASWSKNAETSKHNEMHCRKFRKPCNGDRRDEESQFFDCWDGKHEQSDAFAANGSLGAKRTECLCPVKKDVFQ